MNQSKEKQTWEERWKFKFNEVLHRMYNLEILPDIQSRINVRIPERGGFTLYESDELEDFISTELSLATKQAVQEERERILENLKNAMDTYNSLPDSATQFAFYLKVSDMKDFFEAITKKGTV